MAMELKKELLLTRETHGTYVYQEAEPRVNMQTYPTIYVKKHVFGRQQAPLKITITLTVAEGE